MATVGRYFKETDGSYTYTGKDLKIEMGVPCFVWTRTSQGHEAIDEVGLEANPESHDHYNAANESSYVNGVFTWTEFGPEHSQDDIDATCAGGLDACCDWIRTWLR